MQETISVTNIKMYFLWPQMLLTIDQLYKFLIMRYFTPKSFKQALLNSLNSTFYLLYRFTSLCTEAWTYSHTGILPFFCQVNTLQFQNHSFRCTLRHILSTRLGTSDIYFSERALFYCVVDQMVNCMLCLLNFLGILKKIASSRRQSKVSITQNNYWLYLPYKPHSEVVYQYLSIRL